MQSDTVERNDKAAAKKSKYKWVSAQVNRETVTAIRKWIKRHPDTGYSDFARQAFREKLERDGIKIGAT